MPVNPTVRSLAQDGRFSLRDAETLKSAVTAGTVSQAEAKDVLNRYAEAMDPDAQSALSDAFQQAPRQKLGSFPEGFTDQTLQRGPGRNENVSVLQRGLMAAGLASNNRDMSLPTGADGIFGANTEKSVKAFQKANGIPETGVADPVTLRALQQAMAGAAPSQSRPATTPVTTPPATSVRPSTGLRRPDRPEGATPATTTPATDTTKTTDPTTKPAPALAPVAAAPAAPIVAPTVVPLGAGVRPGTTAAVIDAGTTLATGPRAKNYGTDNPWFNVDPGHAAKVDQRQGGLTGRWKCNLFGGNTLAAAGFEPPRYGNKSPGEYPVAEDWQKWATPTAEARTRAKAEGTSIPDYAARSKNPSRFDLHDEVRPPSLGGTPEEKKARVQAFLDRVQPGDVVTVDHVSAGSDGGHVRVCVGRDPVTNQPLFAQAKQDQARVVAEGPDAFMGEDAMYILRPNTPRTSSPASTK